ncbi:hypothetical protein EV121DRAFT_217483, partial [Schizophyllum commune]
AVAVGLRIRPRRDSQAWETGGSVLGATARSWGEKSGPLLAMPNESGHRDHPEPPEARVRTPRAKDTQVKGPFTLVRGCGLAVVSYCCPRTPPPTPKPPGARAGSLGEISEGGGTSTPLPAFTRGQREVLRTIRLGRAYISVSLSIFVDPRPPEACAGTLDEGRDRDFFDPKPPEASACSLGEGCERGGAPLPLARGKGGVIFADLQPPEACARTLGEGCGRGKVYHLTPHAALLRAQKSGGTAPFAEGSSLVVPPRDEVRQTATASRADTREGEGVHLPRGHVVTR